MLVTVLAQFTPKTINSEKAIYFLSLMSCSVNQLKPHIIHMQKFYAFRFYVEIFFLLKEIVGEGAGAYGRESEIFPCWCPAMFTLLMWKMQFFLSAEKLVEWKLLLSSVVSSIKHVPLFERNI